MGAAAGTYGDIVRNAVERMRAERRWTVAFLAAFVVLLLLMCALLTAVFGAEAAISTVDDDGSAARGAASP